MGSRLRETQGIGDASSSVSGSLAVSQLALEALIGKGGQDPGQASRRLTAAVGFYLRERDSNRPAWPYPSFLRGSRAQEDAVIGLEVPERLWREFEGEAARQDVSVQQLAEHAAFYLAAEIDAGRVTQRILDDLEAQLKLS
jgi:hypothetical protein